ncbi:hypothetical protein SLEP1_g56404 [Rubroshorea leprosula]|uniref:Uncharacterized protein n=1 Tax=Rubroshorea leprosula TaxID=152421 RepID=A0AAV5MID7_9ROSI|nr:hypothetical protein SLEP1_g56404 [Rubroshorea leprosula]
MLFALGLKWLTSREYGLIVQFTSRMTLMCLNYKYRNTIYTINPDELNVLVFQVQALPVVYLKQEVETLVPAWLNALGGAASDYLEQEPQQGDGNGVKRVIMDICKGRMGEF